MGWRGFLQFRHFVSRSAGRRVTWPGPLLLACALLGPPGCARQSSQQAEDSETSGRIQVMSVPEARALMAREIATFVHAYPAARIELLTGTSREAVTSLLEGRVDLVVLTRELEPEERTVNVKGGLELTGYRFARDAICVIVNPANPVEHLASDQLKGIYLGTITDWSEVGGRRGRIEPVVPAPETDLMASFQQRVLGGEPPTAPAFRAANDSATVARVLATPGAIGFVSMASATGDARTLAISALTGLPYVDVDAEKVYRGDYPLTRFCNLYARSDGPKLANGLITWVSSIDGQRLVHEAGLVPTAVPVRFARRSPMLGSH